MMCGEGERKAGGGRKITRGKRKGAMKTALYVQQLQSLVCLEHRAGSEAWPGRE